jgi:hypothetical protein
MICLSIKHPWASLIMRRLKDVEIRYWKGVPKTVRFLELPTRNLQLPILIHASSIDMDALKYLNESGRFNRMDPSEFRKGSILGAAWLVRIHDYSDERDFHNDYRLHLNNDYLLPEKPPGYKCIGLEFGGRLSFPEPIPLKGQLGFFDVELTARSLKPWGAVRRKTDE